MRSGRASRRFRYRPRHSLRHRPRQPRRSPQTARDGHRGQRPRRSNKNQFMHNDSFEVEPWTVRETRLDMKLLGQTESIFALSNGHIGWRANLDEGEPHVVAGSYLNAFYEEAPLPYAETAYGYPQAGQTIVNVTNGKIIRLLVDDEPFDCRYGSLISHDRVLHLKPVAL